MNKEKLLEFAKSILNETDLEKVDHISVSEDVYSDGDPYLEITIDFKGGDKD